MLPYKVSKHHRVHKREPFTTGGEILMDGPGEVLFWLKPSDGMELSTFTQVLNLNTILMYLYPI